MKHETDSGYNVPDDRKLSCPTRTILIPTLGQRESLAVPVEGPCAACGTCAGTFVKRVINRRDATVCVDATGCRDRVTLRALDGPL